MADCVVQPSVTTFAGLSLDRPRIMGIINVTPDSFSDGGETLGAEDAIKRGRAMLAAGADILDIGGESTRPGATPVSVDEECARVSPVIESLASEGALISIDSKRAAVMRAAVTAGAKIVNDVSALDSDPDSLAVIVETDVSVILMHMQGTPQTMQDNPAYDKPPEDIRNYLAGRIAICEAEDISRDRIAVDVGIGFGKTLDHNLELLVRMDVLHALGCAVVIGVSRKSFIGCPTGAKNPKDRVGGSVAAALAARDRGVQIFRVHDVTQARQAFDVWEAIRGTRPS